MPLRLTTADENHAQILASISYRPSLAGQTDLGGMAVSTMTRVRLAPLHTGGTPVPRKPIFTRDTENTEPHGGRVTFSVNLRVLRVSVVKDFTRL
jgi:hypothetical protein